MSFYISPEICYTRVFPNVGYVALKGMWGNSKIMICQLDVWHKNVCRDQLRAQLFSDTLHTDNSRYCSSIFAVFSASFFFTINYTLLDAKSCFFRFLSQAQGFVQSKTIFFVRSLLSYQAIFHASIFLG